MRPQHRDLLRRWLFISLSVFVALALFSPLVHAQSFAAPQESIALAPDTKASSSSGHTLLLVPPEAFSPRTYPWPAPNPLVTYARRFPADPLPQARAVPPQRDVSWKLLPKNFLEDQKDMWITFPDHLLFHGQHWLPTISIISVTGGLIEADPYYTPWFRQTNHFPNFNRYFSKANTDAFLAVGPATVYLVGLWRKDTFAQKTALFSGEAAADGMVFYAIVQEATHRSRPIQIAPHGDFGDSFYDGHHGILSNSFPSGHAVEAFAIASVFDRRYRDHKWVPFIAYGVAGLIAFSRLTLQSHFLSDVFMGSAIGYVTGRYVALQGQ